MLSLERLSLLGNLAAGYALMTTANLQRPAITPISVTICSHVAFTATHLTRHDGEKTTSNAKRIARSLLSLLHTSHVSPADNENVVTYLLPSNIANLPGNNQLTAGISSQHLARAISFRPLVLDNARTSL